VPKAPVEKGGFDCTPFLKRGGGFGRGGKKKITDNFGSEP